MSGITHQLPFKHYHRKEDGTTYFAIDQQIYSAPTCSDMFSCEFDIDVATYIGEWESPAEFEPFRREVEQALGLPFTLNAHEKVRDAINAMDSEWRSDYDYPDFLSVYPVGDTTDDGIAWSWGIDRSVWVGNDRMQQNSRSLPGPVSEKADAGFVAREIVAFMRHNAIKRVQWLNDFVNTCVNHIEQTSGTSPESVRGPWASVKGAAAYDEARSIIATWKGGRA